MGGNRTGAAHFLGCDMSNRLCFVSAFGVFVSIGCGGPAPYWAVQHAEVTFEGDRIFGFQTWEFYSKRWRRNQSDQFHVCARVQQVEGTQVDPMSGCRECDSVYEITLTELESDCVDEIGSDYSYAGSTHYGLGPLTPELDKQNTHDGADLGWYVSWDGQTLEPLGYAWSEAVELESSDTGTVSEPVERLVLWPGYAWQL